MNTKINKKNLILLIVFTIIIGGCLYSWLDIDFSGIEKIKSYLSDFRFTAQIDESEIKESELSSLSDQMSLETGTQDMTEESTEEAISPEKSKDVLGQETTALPEKKKLTLEEIDEQVNEISKKIVLVSIQIQQLSLKKSKVNLIRIIEQEEDPEEIQPTLEEITERVEGISEKVESIRLQLEQFLSEQTC